MKYWPAITRCALMSLILIMAVSTRVYADKAVSYSTEQWPARWSSSMQQQQNVRYPERRTEHIPGDALDRSISQQDLFLNAPGSPSYGRGDADDRNCGQERTARFEDRQSRFGPRRARFGNGNRHWSRAYDVSTGMYPYPNSYYGQAPYAGGYMPYGFDPVMAYPGYGWGIPPLPGPTLGAPLLAYPGFGAWGAPYAW